MATLVVERRGVAVSDRASGETALAVAEASRVSARHRLASERSALVVERPCGRLRGGRRGERRQGDQRDSHFHVRST